MQTSQLLSQSLDSLLRTNKQFYVPPDSRQSVDRPWIVLYGVVMMGWLASLSFSSWDPLRWEIIQLTVSETLGLVSGVLVCCLAWFLLVSRFPLVVVYTTLFGVPIALFGLSVMSLEWRLPVALPSLAGGTCSLLFLLFASRSSLRSLHWLTSFATQVLWANPQLLALSLLLFMVHLAFTLVWGLALSRTMGTTLLSQPFSWTTAYAVLVYFWTSSILQHYQKMVVSSIVGLWYFCRYDGIRVDATKEHALAILKHSFGTVVCASFMMGSLHALQAMFRRKKSHGVLRWLGDLVQDMSCYSVVYSGLTGLSFFATASKCARLFKKNWMLGLLSHTISKCLGLVGRLLVSCVAVLLSLKVNEEAWAVSGLTGLVSFYLVGTLTLLVQDTIHAAFVCYLVDLDTDACHCDSAHRVFSK